MGNDPTSPSNEFPSKSAEELESLINKTRDKLLCNRIINNSTRFVNRITGLRLKEDSLYTIGLVTVLLSSSFYLATTAMSYAFDRSIRIVNPASILVSVLAAFSFSIVKGLHDNILPSEGNNFAKNLIPVAPEGSLTAMRDWWKSFLSSCQYVFVGICGLLSVFTLFVFAKYTSIHFHFGSFVLMFICGIALGHGGYCAVLIPRLAKAMTAAPIRVFWLHPADSPWIREASSVFTKLSLANALIFTCCIVGLIWPRPWKSSIPAIVATIWLLVTLCVVLYSFIYPHYHLGRAIKAAKKKEMSKMQDLIAFKQEWVLDPGGEAEIKKLNEVVKVYDQLAASRDSAIDMRARLSFFFSLAIPILSFVGIIIRLGSIVANYLGVQRNP